MKAISLWQPWASAIALGHKRIETRHWPTKYLGSIAIHAAKRWTREEREFAIELRESGITVPAYDYPLGAIVATATLYDCMRTEYAMNEMFISPTEQQLGNFARGRYAWLLRDIYALPEPIPYKGAQGLFNIPDGVFDAGR